MEDGADVAGIALSAHPPGGARGGGGGLSQMSLRASVVVCAILLSRLKSAFAHTDFCQKGLLSSGTAAVPLCHPHISADIERGCGVQRNTLWLSHHAFSHQTQFWQATAGE